MHAGWEVFRLGRDDLKVTMAHPGGGGDRTWPQDRGLEERHDLSAGMRVAGARRGGSQRKAPRAALEPHLKAPGGMG